jgi:AcrR family transcriptional regulator
MKDIAKGCGMVPSNIYNHFKNKEQILYTILRDDINSLISAIQFLEDEEIMHPVEQLRTFVHIHTRDALSTTGPHPIYFETEWRHLSHRHQQVIIKSRDIYNRILRKIIMRGVNAGVFRKVNEKLFNYVISSTIIGARMWYKPQGELSLNEISDAFFEIFLNGLSCHVDNLKETKYKQSDI